MARPDDVGSYGELLYSRVAPLAYADEANGWGLLILCGAIGTMHQTVHDLVSETDDGPGWSPLLDVDRIPAQFLPYLAQIVGERIPDGEPEADARERVRVPQGQRRGTRPALYRTARKRLTGNKTVLVFPRNGSAYRILVATRTAETPDPAGTEYDLRTEWKPVDLILDYVVVDGAIIEELSGTIDDLAGTIDDLLDP